MVELASDMGDRSLIIDSVFVNIQRYHNEYWATIVQTIVQKAETWSVVLYGSIKLIFCYYFFSFTTETANPSIMSMMNLPFFYYDGDCNDPNTQDQIKKNFLDLMKSGMVLPVFCKDKPKECNEDTIDIYCGDVDAAVRRRRRSSTKSVWSDAAPSFQPDNFICLLVRINSLLYKKTNTNVHFFPAHQHEC